MGSVKKDKSLQSENKTSSTAQVSNKEIKKEEEAAKESWEDVKDKTTGVDKEIEKKLEDGSIEPEDLDTLNG